MLLKGKDRGDNAPRSYLFPLIFCVLFIFAGCSVGPALDVSNFTARTRHTTVAFGTVSILRLYEDFSADVNNARFERVWAETRALLVELDGIFSHNIETSDVSRFNALEYGESIKISHHMAEMVKAARELYEKTDRLFDPTVYPLVDLWGFTPRFRAIRFVPVMPYDRALGREELPSDEYVEAFLRLVYFDGIVLGGNKAEGFTLTKMVPPVVVNGVTYQAKLGFGALVKGYATNLVYEIIAREGFEFGYFSCGGSSMVLLNGMDYREDGAYEFNLRLRKPRTGQTQETAFAAIRTGSQSLSTSGDYDHAFFVDGIRYSHIFDPRTGRPINLPVTGPQRGLASATVLGADGVHLEGLSTALLIMTLTEAIDFVNQYDDEDIMVVLVYYKSGYEFYEIITNIPHLINILDPAYILASRLDTYGNIKYTGVAN